MKAKILVVDDDPQIRESLFKVLRAEGHEVVLAADGPEGIEKFNTEQIDLLLLDLNLPGNSGWDVFGTLTSLNPFLPIIIITGRNNRRRRVSSDWSACTATCVTCRRRTPFHPTRCHELRPTN
jgi:DNA-binding response OmpR family regulator